MKVLSFCQTPESMRGSRSTVKLPVEFIVLFYEKKRCLSSFCRKVQLPLYCFALLLNPHLEGNHMEWAVFPVTPINIFLVRSRSLSEFYSIYQNFFGFWIIYCTSPTFWQIFPGRKWLSLNSPLIWSLLLPDTLQENRASAFDSRSLTPKNQLEISR